MTDQIVVRIPASTAHIGLFRAAASAVAALCDFTYDRITDLHIAVDEVCSRVLATSEPTPTRLEVTFTIADSGLKVEVRGDSRLKEGALFLTDWSRAILEAVARNVEVGSPDGVVEASFEVPKG